MAPMNKAECTVPLRKNEALAVMLKDKRTLAREFEEMKDVWTLKVLAKRDMTQELAGDKTNWERRIALSNRFLNIAEMEFDDGMVPKSSIRESVVYAKLLIKNAGLMRIEKVLPLLDKSAALLAKLGLLIEADTTQDEADKLRRGQVGWN